MNSTMKYKRCRYRQVPFRGQGYIARTNLGLTQSVYAQLFIVHPISISKWERGVVNIESNPNGSYLMYLSVSSALVYQGRGKRKGTMVRNLLIRKGWFAAFRELLKGLDHKKWRLDPKWR